MSYLVLQIGTPLALLAWLWLLPPGNRLGLLLLVAAAASWITAVELAGLWLIVPYWLTSIFALVLIGGSWRAWRRRLARFWPPGPREWLGPALCLVLGAAGGLFIADWIEAHRAPAGEIVDLARPLGRGNYRIANGGNSATLNAHFMTLDQSSARFRPYYGQSLALDIVRLNSLGRTASGLRPSDPAAYAIFGDPVLAPCEGAVVSALDGRHDMSVPRMDRAVMLGNHVILACGPHHVVLAHFRRGSLRVKIGDKVNIGQPLGQVGNSGNSAEPHLHIHLQRPGTPTEPISGSPVPMTIEGRYLVRNNTL